MTPKLATVQLRRQGRKIEEFTSSVDPEDPEDLQNLLEDAVSRDPHRGEDPNLAEYEIRVWPHKGRRIDYVGRNKRPRGQ